MTKKTESDVALEMYQSVMQTIEKKKRLKSSTFWRLFHVKTRKKTVIDRISNIIDKQGLKITNKSGALLGQEDDADWIVLIPKLLPPPPKLPENKIPSLLPSTEWFEIMKTRQFESEREVEAYFVVPLLEKLGYAYDDIVIGHPVEMTKGVKKTIVEADFVVFNGPNRGKENVLLVIETKKTGRGISTDQTDQARSYARELFPACYIVSDGQQILIFQFNGMLIPDEPLMEFDRTALLDKWDDLYKCISKEAAKQRKQWIVELISSIKTDV
jgi:hypothetical protein